MRRQRLSTAPPHARQSVTRRLTLFGGLVLCLFGIDTKERSVFAQIPAQSAERSVFAPEPAAFFFPRVNCHRAHCKKYEGVFPSTPIWTHTTNITRPPRPLWFFTCHRRSDGTYFYASRRLLPGQTIWATLRIPNGQWGWIQNWTVDYTPFAGLLQLAHNTSRMADDGTLINEAVGTVQIDTVPGLSPIAEQVLHNPGDTPPWAIESVFDGAGGAEVRFDGLGSDPLIDETVAANMIVRPGFSELVQVLDRGSDGTPDGSLVLTCTGGPDSQSMLLQVFDLDGNLEFRLSVDFQQLGTFSTTLYETDSNGDGLVDRVEIEETETFGTDSFMFTQTDENGDGIFERFEEMTLSYDGDLSAAQVNQVMTNTGTGGVDIELIQLELQPFGPGGYQIETLHDVDGDGAFDTRERQQSVVGDFLAGVDIDEFSIDQDNDGVFDQIVNVTTEKTLSGSTYVESVASDVGADGTVDASAERIVTFGGGATPFRRGDANSDGIVNIGDPVWTLSFFFAGGPPPSCEDAGDTNDDGTYNLADAIRTFDYIFLGGSPPPPPFPGCGVDATPSPLTCSSYSACP